MHPIVLRIHYLGKRRDMFTGLYCHQDQWDRENRMMTTACPEAGLFNRNLQSIKSNVFTAYNELRCQSNTFPIRSLTDKIKGKQQNMLITSYLIEEEKFMQNRVGNEITKATYFKYRRSILHVTKFLTANNLHDLPLVNIDTHLLRSYFNFLRTTGNISHNTAVKYLSFLRALLSRAIRSGWMPERSFKELHLRELPISIQFLTQEDVAKLKIWDSDNKTLLFKRDIFLFACYTGLSYIDIKELGKNHIHQDPGGSYYIVKPRQKTRQESIIPILPAAEAILKKYSLTHTVRDFNWRVPSNQKLNAGLKEIGKKASLSNTLHMHIARHTFATTITLANGIPIETVSKMLGHANFRQTQHYAKIVASKIKNDMAPLKDIYK